MTSSKLPSAELNFPSKIPLFIAISLLNKLLDKLLCCSTHTHSDKYVSTVLSQRIMLL